MIDPNTSGQIGLLVPALAAGESLGPAAFPGLLLKYRSSTVDKIGQHVVSWL